MTEVVQVVTGALLLISALVGAFYAGWWCRAYAARHQLAELVAVVQQAAAEPALTLGQWTCDGCSAPIPDRTLRQHDGRRLCPTCKGKAA